MSRRQFLHLTAGATAGAAVGPRVAAAQSRPKTGGTFISAKTTEAPSLDPILDQSLGRHRIDPLFYNRVVEWGADGKLEPALAESWTTSA
ncbi:MAG: ABC transporter substrate-binding protein, partial [Candidatus Rokuibacteriota bacterium]